ncbi:MAG: hypothetical protein AAGE65_10685, partial [Planctomycetota bacterium]
MNHYNLDFTGDLRAQRRINDALWRDDDGTASASFSSFDAWIEHCSGHPSTECLGQRRAAGAPITMAHFQNDLAFSDPAVPDLVLQLVVGGGTSLTFDAGFGPVQVRASSSSNHFCTVPAGRPFEVSEAEPSPFELLVLGLPWSAMRARVEETLQREVPDLGGAVHGRLLRDDKVTRLMHELWSEAASDCPGGSVYTEGLASALVGRLLQLGKTPLPDVPRAGRAGGKLSAATMRRVEEFVAERLEGALRLDELADVACVSKFHFSRLFKR